MRSVGIIGLGSIGRRHARILKTLQPDLRIDAFRTKRGALQYASEYAADLDRDEFFRSIFDVLIISNPSSMHLRTLRDVLQGHLAGTILVEKPFCLPEEAPAAKALLREFDRVNILPGNTLRFHPAVSLLRTSLQDGELGEV